MKRVFSFVKKFFGCDDERYLSKLELRPEISSIDFDSESGKNTAIPLFKPMGQPVQSECSVIDNVTQKMIPYACEFIQEDGVYKLNVLNVKPVDLSKKRCRFTYLSFNSKNR